MRFSAVFLLPGTVIHELSHYLVAEILQVRTGNINLYPAKNEEGKLRLGSVAIAQTDPFRKILIGTAPLWTGLGIIAALIYIIVDKIPPLFFLILIFTAIFLIASTMFSSKKDLTDMFVPTFLLFIIWLFLYLTKTALPEAVITFFSHILISLNLGLLVTLAIYLIFLCLLYMATRLFSLILKRKIITK
ncbi:hypothetical protein GYA49_02430 [Candidatus Beckwithbacteria bacterium]|nr:hypothetical protein [Candidatus Beckwithbacteria bacterium]